METSTVDKTEIGKPPLGYSAFFPIYRFVNQLIQNDIYNSGIEDPNELTEYLIDHIKARLEEDYRESPDSFYDMLLPESGKHYLVFQLSGITYAVNVLHAVNLDIDETTNELVTNNGPEIIIMAEQPLRLEISNRRFVMHEYEKGTSLNYIATHYEDQTISRTIFFDLSESVIGIQDYTYSFQEGQMVKDTHTSRIGHSDIHALEWTETYMNPDKSWFDIPNSLIGEPVGKLWLYRQTRGERLGKLTETSYTLYVAEEPLSYKEFRRRQKEGDYSSIYSKHERLPEGDCIMSHVSHEGIEYIIQIDSINDKVVCSVNNVIVGEFKAGDRSYTYQPPYHMESGVSVVLDRNGYSFYLENCLVTIQIQDGHIPYAKLLPAA